MILGYKCISCSAEYSFKNIIYTCPKCDNNLEATFDFNVVKNILTKKQLNSNQDKSIWRYSPLYPTKTRIDSPFIGNTCLYKSENLEKLLGLSSIFLKDETRNPSASFKDRASIMALSFALDNNINLITSASTGNAASSLACLSSLNRVKNIIFVPKSAPEAKIVQLLIFGARVLAVNGTYDQAFELCIKVSNEFGWYCRNTGYNPITREGKKSAAFEICEQLKWKAPDNLFVSVGDGNIISGLWKGFKEFYEIGLIDKLPKMIACQAKGSNSIKLAFDNKTDLPIVSGDTVADSISVSYPRDGLAAIKAIKESNGFAIDLTDKEILDSIKILAQNTAIFAEPAGATSLAGLIKATNLSKINSSESNVLLITGNGLKDIKSASKISGTPIFIEPDIDLKSILSLI